MEPILDWYNPLAKLGLLVPKTVYRTHVKKIKKSLITSSFAFSHCLCNSCGSGACSRSSCNSGGDDGDGGGDDGSNGGSGGKSERTHYLQQVGLSQKALLLLPGLSQ